MSNGTAPVCPISRSQAVPGSPGRNLPIVPRALDLPSLIQAVNTIRNILMMVNIGPVTNNIYPPLPFGYPQLQGQNTAQPSSGGGRIKRGWYETDRETEKLLIQHSEQQPTTSGDRDIAAIRSDQIVIVDRLKQLVFRSNPGFGMLDKDFVWDQKHEGAGDPQF